MAQIILQVQAGWQQVWGLVWGFFYLPIFQAIPGSDADLAAALGSACFENWLVWLGVLHHGLKDTKIQSLPAKAV